MYRHEGRRDHRGSRWWKGRSGARTHLDYPASGYSSLPRLHPGCHMIRCLRSEIEQLRLAAADRAAALDAGRQLAAELVGAITEANLPADILGEAQLHASSLLGQTSVLRAELRSSAAERARP